MRRHPLGLLVAALILFLAGGGGLLLLQQASIMPAQPAYAQANGSTQQDIITAVRAVTPAVVNIDTVSMEQPGSDLPPALREFFGQGERPFPEEGVGSGVIIDRRGYVLTNYHVVRGADRMTVTLQDGREFKARLVGTDSVSDLALVQIPGDSYPVVPLGSASELPIGSWLIAVGNPFRLQSTVTVGVLSARGRSLRAPDGRRLTALLQTDAAINPGNSGGALVDLRGRLIGTPTAIIASAQGIGFAVSVDEAKPVIRQLMEHGRVERPWLGVYYGPLTDSLRRQYRVPQQVQGVIVARVLPGSPAAEAGVRTGDVIEQFAGHAIRTPDQLHDMVLATRPGESVKLTISRAGRRQTVTVKVGIQPARLPDVAEGQP